MLWNVSNTKNYTNMTREEFDSIQWSGYELYIIYDSNTRYLCDTWQGVKG